MSDDEGGMDGGDDENILEDTVEEHEEYEDEMKAAAAEDAAGAGDQDYDPNAPAVDLISSQSNLPLSSSQAQILASIPSLPNPPQAVPPDQRTTTAYLTKYERARLLGTRALQISLGAPVLVDLGDSVDPLEI